MFSLDLTNHTLAIHSLITHVLPILLPYFHFPHIEILHVYINSCFLQQRK